MADTKGQVDWQMTAAQSLVIANESKEPLVAAWAIALRTTFEPLVKAAEEADALFGDAHHLKDLRAALDGLPKVGG